MSRLKIFRLSRQQKVCFSTGIKSFVLFLFSFELLTVQVSASDGAHKRQAALWNEVSHVLSSKCPQEIADRVHEWKSIRDEIEDYHRFQKDRSSSFSFEPARLECMANILCYKRPRMNLKALVNIERKCNAAQASIVDAKSDYDMQDLDTEPEVSSEVDEAFPTVTTNSKPTEVLFEVAPSKISCFLIGFVTGIIATYSYFHAALGNPANAVRLRRPEL